MEAQADRHRTERSFEVGDSVLLKLQPFIQTSIAQRPFQKLAFRYYGPCKIISKVGAVAHKLDLPPTSKIHPVVHVSLLKKAEGAEVQGNPDLPPANEILQAEHAPLAVLAARQARTASNEQTRLLIHWERLPASLATWEDPVLLQQQFPTTPP
ncbi:uncharacterized protein [Aegilops tauschii subsp. strangulata]|uniref:uncharacterized protein n=1 Tax=Aegilops tauschii subsp. strangulata TaxID=200361 RepID=UPI003CC8B915